MEKWAFEQLYKIAGWNIEKYYLQSPIICHGYAGTAIIFYELYHRFHNNIFNDKGNQLIALLVNTYNKNNLYGFKDIIIRQSNGTAIVEEKDKLDFLNGACGCGKITREKADAVRMFPFKNCYPQVFAL